MTSHGSTPRGEASVPRSALHEGRFGRMFRRLPAAPPYDDAALSQLAETMREQVPAGWDDAAPIQDGDNQLIPAAYTYLGQFIDHDITFDPASSLQRENDPDALTNYRSPRFDLDSLFGSGPAAQPFLYERQGGRLLVEPNIKGELDLPRNSQGIALTGDPRNDENTVVSQLHLTFAKAFNKLLEQVQADPAVAPEQQFETAQRLLRYHYQWIVAFDFLPRICGAELIDALLRHDKDGDWEIKRPHYRPRVEAFMPVEFSAAAFRYGHSQVRPTYDLNTVVTARSIFAPGDDVGELDDLRGFRPLPGGWTVHWPLFVEAADGLVPQPSRLINSKLSSALFDLPGEAQPDMQSLAFRNLKRGQSLGLPSGQDVARALRAPHVFTGEEMGAPEPTPLWFYLLKEGELEADNAGVRLGLCAGRIVAETLLGILEIDNRSWVNVDPEWTPSIPAADGEFKLRDLIAFAS